MLFSKPQVSFFENFASLSSVMKGNSSVLFLDQTLHTFHGRDQSKCKFFRLLTARIKIHESLFSLETISQFFFKLWINDQCHKTQLLCTFVAEILYFFNKRGPSRQKFGEIGSLKFDTLMGSFRQNNIKFQLKKYRTVISHDTED